MPRLLCLLVLLATVTALVTPAAAQLAVGANAPDFTLSDTQGVPRTLSDYDGQVVVLFFVGWG